MHVSLKVSKFLYRPILERLCHKFQVMSTTSTNRYQSKSIVEFYLTFAFNGISFLWVWRMEESSVRSILESSLLSSSLSFNASRDNITLSEIAQRPSQLNLEKLAQNTMSLCYIGILKMCNSISCTNIVYIWWSFLQKKIMAIIFTTILPQKSKCLWWKEKIFGSACKNYSALDIYIYCQAISFSKGAWMLLTWEREREREKLFRLFQKSKSTWVPFGLDANFTS